MATATALNSLRPGRKHDEMAQRVIRMFKVRFARLNCQVSIMLMPYYCVFILAYCGVFKSIPGSNLYGFSGRF